MGGSTTNSPERQPDRRTEHVDVLVVGAGLSGIAAGHHLQTTCPWASYAIFEARDAIGGTWDLFRYPGIRSDSDMYTLGYPFRPWTGEKAIADGPDILAVHRGHRRRGRASTGTSGSTTGSSRPTGPAPTPAGTSPRSAPTPTRSSPSRAGSCSRAPGYYRYDHGYTPDFAGTDHFTGQLVHPQAWPEDFDGAGKRIVVIGSGATAVTLIPSLAETADHVTMLQRSPSYIAAVPPKAPIARLLERVLPLRWSAPLTRWIAALGSQAFFRWCQRFPRAARKLLRKGVQLQLPDDYDIDTHFTPHYDPWDQRLCVDPDGLFFKAIKRGTASVVTDRIETFTETGVLLESGRHLDADVIVTATGLELLFMGGIEISVDGDPVDLAEKLTYKGMMLEGVPNLAMAVGYTNASWTLKCDLTCDYVARLLNEMRDRGRAQATPRNRDGSVSPEPLLGLSAGYVQRSAHRFPRQGSAAPWRVHQSYLRDYRALKMDDVVDDAMELTNPPAAAHEHGSDQTPIGAGAGSPATG